MNLGEDYRIDSILTQIMPCIQVQPIYIISILYFLYFLAIGIRCQSTCQNCSCFSNNGSLSTRRQRQVSYRGNVAPPTCHCMLHIVVLYSTIEHLLPLFLTQLKDEVSPFVFGYFIYISTVL